MAVSVRLDFTPPMMLDVAKLHVEEAPDVGGPFSEIDQTTEVGTYPNYISAFTTENATTTTYWFRIRWETTEAVFSPYSEALQGGTKTLVQEIVDRTMLRNPSLNEIIVTQEAQAVIASVYNTDDPNSISVEESNPIEIRGMTNMTLARSLIATSLASGGSASQFTAGLVSIKSGTTGADPTKAIEALIKAANEDLGGGTSLILLMSEIETGRGYPALHGTDLTRAIAMVSY